MRKYEYNRVLEECGIFQKNELVTDKEIPNIQRKFGRCRGLRTEKVKVPRETIVFIFGARFSTMYENL